INRPMEPRTILYLIRHGATEANLARPARIQGRRHDPSLAGLGVRQAEATRDLLADRRLDHCYCSPLLPAVQTAAIVAAPHAAGARPPAGLRGRPRGGARRAALPPPCRRGLSALPRQPRRVRLPRWGVVRPGPRPRRPLPPRTAGTPRLRDDPRRRPPRRQ